MYLGVGGSFFPIPKEEESKRIHGYTVSLLSPLSESSEKQR